MTWRTNTVGGFEDFVNGLRDILPTSVGDDGHYWFRGQSNGDWDLEPSLMRSSGGLGLSAEDAIGLEREALKAFQCKAHLFVSPQLLEKVKTIPCWWALMQHHGAPTRLLDWTVSPYVAAYFAAQQDGSQKPGAVWCFCSGTLGKTFQKEYGSPPSFVSDKAVAWYERKFRELEGKRVVMPLTFSHASSERIVAQQGRFTMCFKIHQKHNCIIQQIGKDFIRKIEIPHDKKPEFLLRLRDMNITGSALFPGVDGLGQSVRELVSLGGYYKKALPALHTPVAGRKTSAVRDMERTRRRKARRRAAGVHAPGDGGGDGVAAGAALVGAVKRGGEAVTHTFAPGARSARSALQRRTRRIAGKTN